MTVTYHHYSHTGSEPPLIILHVVGAADIAAFKELIQRGSNLAPNLPASMKELADLALLGRVLQDYKAQEQRENPVAKTSAISFTMSQGWKLKGGICPVLYSDTVNGYGVGRDDLWLATTDALKSAQPVEVQRAVPEPTPEMVIAGAAAARDYYEETGGNDPAVIYRAMLAAAPMVDVVPPATSRDRWMYEQGRLAERDPRTHGKPIDVQPVQVRRVPMKPEEIELNIGPDEGDREAVTAIVREVEEWHGIKPTSSEGATND